MIDIIDDKFTTIQDDIDRVQKNPTIYISFVGPDAVKQLCYECTNNMIDEHSATNSISTGEMSIFVDYQLGEIYFQDSGRGIEFSEMENACTILQSGTKMERAYSNKSGGENGVGLTTTNALSELFEMTSTRNGRCKYIKYRNGRLIETKEFEIGDKSKHGLLVGFIPSKYFLGEDAELPLDSFMEWLEKQSFQMDPKIKLKLVISGLPGTTVDKTVVYQNTQGINGFLKRFEPDATLLPKPVVLSGTMNGIKETVPVLTDKEDGTKEFVMTEMDRYITVDIAFNYNPMENTQKCYAFTNNIENIHGGEHVKAVTSALTSYFTKAANNTEAKSGGQKKKKKTEVVATDVIAGMSVVVILTTNLSTRFENQTKHVLGNKAFYEPVRKLTTQAIQEWGKLNENKGTIGKIVSFLKTNAKLRESSTNTRSKIKTSDSFMDSKLITGYTPPNFINMSIEERKKKNIPLIIYIGEGDSAGNGLRNGRYNNDIQGILNLRGVPDNIYKKLLASLDTGKGATHSLWKVFFNNILGCGYGRNFDITKLKYDYICLVPDADIDGDHIATLLLAGIIKGAPQLIQEGHVYRVVPPLYCVRQYGKKTQSGVIDKNSYLYSKMEIYNPFVETLSTRVYLKHQVDGKSLDKIPFMNTSELKRFVIANRNYRAIINTIRDRYRLDYDTIEFIAAHKDFAAQIQEFDRELIYDEAASSITGSHNKKHCAILLNDVFMEQIWKLRDILEANNWELFYHCYEKTGKDMEYKGVLSIGYIMDLCWKYYPEITSRFKGIGEMDVNEVHELLMNPNNQKLVRFTMPELATVQAAFDDLFLDETTHVRKQIIDSMRMSLEDIDN